MPVAMKIVVKDVKKVVANVVEMDTITCAIELPLPCSHFHSFLVNVYFIETEIKTSFYDEIKASYCDCSYSWIAKGRMYVAIGFADNYAYANEVDLSNTVIKDKTNIYIYIYIYILVLYTVKAIGVVLWRQGFKKKCKAAYSLISYFNIR